MKTLIAIALLLAVASCQVYPFNVGSECSTAKCPRSYWTVGNVDQSYTCPLSGKSTAAFTLQRGQYFFNFTAYNFMSTDVKVSIPLTYVPKPSQNGVQYFSNLKSNEQFAIMNCTIAGATAYSSLCNKYPLVGIKVIKNVFESSCAFGLSPSARSFLQQAGDFEFEANY
ncbi:hypothetical protein TTHERM_00592950 (macronuclear) [Tetrahymena thermophila SB210]|uniref:Transmembrane protein n=1 Tax=Tetrahymena thermophila (strain SB210) TaxID=312017 RepID=Q232K3_TETTS|nr:hypothetical protein TTHERM_00592950 [Tetrahymena thermophila SB210]EAR91409.1 hypothetical protein TTHERM_00592950 [Tetrahymena thermophila SB210]|eukprot:XP_001011654.1 hypothetical protein TTHERM_00592950 [Tetrahymena thermophila SB210]